MTKPSAILALIAASSLGIAVHFYRQNQRLEDRLDAVETPAAAKSEIAETSPEGRAATAVARAKKSLSALPSNAVHFSSVSRPTLPEAPTESWRDRRLRVEGQISAYFGRAEGETEDEYRARLKPAVEGILAGPREKLEDARDEVEALASVTSKQRARLDAIFDDSITEAMALTNQAIASGDLTPYRRNWAGVGQTVGGLSAIVDSTEERLQDVLTPEQLEIITESGFEWGEYLAVKVPWQDLAPPPPPPAADGATAVSTR